MTVVSINLNKIVVEKKGGVEGKLSIKNNVNIDKIELKKLHALIFS